MMITASTQVFSVEKILHSKPLFFSKYLSYLIFTFSAWTGEGRVAV